MLENIKIVVSDMDGTLFTDDKKILPSTIEAIKKIKEKNIIFGLCTGRETQTVEKIVKNLGIHKYVDFIIGLGGGEIYDYILNYKKPTYRLNKNAIKDIIKHFDDMDLNFGIPENGVMYFPKMNRFTEILSKFDMMPYKVVDFDKYLINDKSKLMIVCDEQYMPNVIERSKSFSSDYYNGTPIRTTKIFLEFMDKNVSKSNALKIYVTNHNLSLDNILAFGDADNDYDMLKNCKIGVAMKNGSEKTKSIANYITDDNNNDGIANFINQYLN